MAETIGFKQKVQKVANDFAAFYGRNQQSSETLKWILRFGSIAFSATNINILLLKNLKVIPNFNPSISEILFYSVITGLVIEYGWNKKLPIVVRQVVCLKFDDAHWVLMFLFNFVILGSLGYANIKTTLLGADHAGENSLGEFVYTDISHLESEAANLKDSIERIFQIEKGEIQQRYDAIKENIVLKANSEKKAADATISWYRKREYEEEKSYRSKRYQFKKAKADADAAGFGLLVLQDSLAQSEIKDRRKSRDIEIKKIEAWLANEIRPIREKDEKEKKQLAQLQAGFYSIMITLAWVCWAGIILICIASEIYRKKSNQDSGDNYIHSYPIPWTLKVWSKIQEVFPKHAEDGSTLLVRILHVVLRIVLSWADYFVELFEAKFPTPKTRPGKVEWDPFGLRQSPGQQAGKNQSTGWSWLRQRIGQRIGQQGSGSTAQSQLSTGFHGVNVPQQNIGFPIPQQKVNDPQHEVGFNQNNSFQNTIKIEVNGEEPTWPHIDGHTGKTVQKTLNQCMSSRASYRTKIKATKSKKPVDKALLAYQMELEAYWDNAINVLREAKAEIKRLKKAKN